MKNADAVRESIQAAQREGLARLVVPHLQAIAVALGGAVVVAVIDPLDPRGRDVFPGLARAYADAPKGAMPSLALVAAQNGVGVFAATDSGTVCLSNSTRWVVEERREAEASKAASQAPAPMADVSNVAA